MSDAVFQRGATVVLWVTVVVTGLGMELVVGTPMVKYMGDDPRAMHFWKASQLFFSLSISVALFFLSPFGLPWLNADPDPDPDPDPNQVALFSQSVFGLPWAVIGFWKFGFPETAGCFRRAFRTGAQSCHPGVLLAALSAWMNGSGTFLHHASGAYLITACTTHLMPLDRHVPMMP